MAENYTTHTLNENVADSEPKKRRGRKGNKIKNAFKNVPNTPVNFEDYAKQHGVSMNVLRQIKRHDIYAKELGKVFIRKNKQTKIMEIWRDPNIK